MHKTIRKVSADIEEMKFNTAIASLMTLLNQFAEKGCNRAEFATFITLVNPFAPHITEELWHTMGLGEGFLSIAPWPAYDESKTVDAEIEMAVQVNGKLKAVVKLPADADEDTAKAAALADEKVAAAVEGKNIVKVIVIRGKIINIVVK